MIHYSNSGFLIGLLLHFRGSVIPKALAFGLISGSAAALLVSLNASYDWMDDFGSHALNSSQLWGAMTLTLSFLIGFRTNKAYARFWTGTTLLHQMRGEWFDSSSCLIAFSTLPAETRPVEVANFRHTLIRLMSLCHASALEEISFHSEDEDKYLTLDIGGLDQKTLKYLRKCKSNKDLNFNRVEVIIHMIQTLIVRAQQSKVIDIPPPIVTRVFQTLSRGQVHLMNCKKITCTLFPLPYAQLIAFFLHTFLVLAPIVVSSICEDRRWALIFTAVPVCGLYAMNDVARVLEMPFGDDHNDLPLEEFQTDMNNSLLMLIREEADIVPCTSQSCKKDFDSTKAGLSGRRLRSFVHSDEGEQKSSLQETKSGDPCDVSCWPVLQPPPAPAQACAPAAPAAFQYASENSVSTCRSRGSAPAAPAALEEALRRTTEDLSQHFVDLKANTKRLSDQLCQTTEVMLQFSLATRSELSAEALALDPASLSAPKAPPSSTAFKCCPAAPRSPYVVSQPMRR